MKTTLTLFVALLVSCSSILATGSTERSVNDNKITLQLKLAKGAEYKQVITVDNKISVYSESDPDIKMDQAMLMGMYYTSKVLSTPDPITLSSTYSRVYMKMSMLGNTMSIDTDSLDQLTDSTSVEMGETYKKMLNKPLKMTFSPDGTMLTSEDFDELAEDGKSMKNDLSNSSTTFPKKPIGIGDTWQKDVPVTTDDMNYITANTYTLSKVSNGVAYINIKSTIKQTPNADGTEASSKIAGGQTGTLEVDIATGWTIKSTIKQSLTITTEDYGTVYITEMNGTTTIETIK